MAGTIANVNIGPCWAYYGTKGAEVDLGWTQGGIKVNFATETTEVEADQETDAIMISITKRPIGVTVPSIEYTLGNLQRALPGSIFYSSGSSFTSNLTGENNDMVFTAKGGVINSPLTIAYVDPGEILAACTVEVIDTAITVTLKHDGSAITATAANVKTAIDEDTDAAALITVANAGTDTGAGIVTAMPTATFTGGKQKLVIKSAANEDFTSLAKNLILHPTNKEEGDTSMDMTFPGAVPVGTFEIDYSKENPKIINLEFKILPDSTGVSVIIGDSTTEEE